jgi:glycosyltransferase involved in cell wall biosynthesis
LPSVLFTTFRIFYIILKEKPDLLLVNSFYPLVYTWFIKIFIKTPLMWVVHTSDVSINNSVKLISKCDIIVGCCSSILTPYQKLFPEKIFFTVYNAPNSLLKKVKNQPKDKITSTDIFNLCFIGRIDENKNLKNLIKSLPILLKKKKNIKLTVIGDGPSFKQILELASSLRLDEFINFKGYVSDPGILLNEMDALCLPSYNEAFPLVILEAQYLGIPVVATNVGGVSESVTDGETGFIISSTTPEDIANTLLRVINTPVSRIKEITIRARKQMNEKFSKEKQKTAFLSAISTCIRE